VEMVLVGKTIEIGELSIGIVIKGIIAIVVIIAIIVIRI
jgi:hypothetical protein